MNNRIIVKKINWRSTKNNRVENIDLEMDVEVGFFRCRTANECLRAAKIQTIPNRLYGSLIFEKELSILFADTGVGKTILAVQIANDISMSEKVLYFDLELTEKQFQSRYSDNYEKEFEFNSNFLRVDFKRKFEMPDNTTYEAYFIASLKNLIIKTGAKVVVIDNMTRLISGDTDQAKSAKPLMDSLNNLKFDFDLTLILLEHTKKVDPNRPIQLNDLQGSKMKANFADSIFAIGKSTKDKNIRYVKQLKVRSCEMEHDSDNVIEYQIVKENSFIHFNHTGFGSEAGHLKQNVDRISLAESARELKESGLSIRKIVEILGIPRSTVGRLVKPMPKDIAVPDFLSGQMGQVSNIQTI